MTISEQRSIGNRTRSTAGGRKEVRAPYARYGHNFFNAYIFGKGSDILQEFYFAFWGYFLGLLNSKHSQLL